MTGTILQRSAVGGGGPPAAPPKRIDPQHHQVLRDEIFVCWSKIVLAAAAGGSSIKMAFPLDNVPLFLAETHFSPRRSDTSMSLTEVSPVDERIECVCEIFQNFIRFFCSLIPVFCGNGNERGEQKKIVALTILFVC